MLKAVGGGPLTRSKIMYYTMLNFRQVQHYGITLENAGLMKYAKESKTYHITEKGRSFLRLYDETSKLLNKSLIIGNDVMDNNYNQQKTLWKFKEDV
jgi:predicted transcriptional regulator